MLAGFGKTDLVDANANSAFRANVGPTIAQLDGHHCFCRRNSEHWEQIHSRIRASADHRHNLGYAKLLCDFWVKFGDGCGCKTNEELVDDVQEERHRGGKPISSSWSHLPQASSPNESRSRDPRFITPSFCTNTMGSKTQPSVVQDEMHRPTNKFPQLQVHRGRLARKLAPLLNSQHQLRRNAQTIPCPLHIQRWFLFCSHWKLQYRNKSIWNMMNCSPIQRCLAPPRTERR